MEITVVSKGEASKGITHEFKADTEAETEEKQGAELDGPSVSLCFTGERTKARENWKEKLLEW